MKNKNTCLKRHTAPLFKESRFVFEAGKGIESYSELVEVGHQLHEDTVTFLQTVKPEMTDPDKFLDENPFAEYLYAVAENYLKTEDDWVFDIEESPGQFKLRWMDAEGNVAKTKDFDAYEYLALYWDFVSSKVDSLFKASGHNIPQALYFTAAQESKPKFRTLLMAVAAQQSPSKDMIDAAAAELLAALPTTVELKKHKAGVEATAERAELRGKLPQEKPEIIELNRSIDTSAIAERMNAARAIESEKMQATMRAGKVEIIARNKEINPKNWNFSPEGLQKIIQNWKTLGIYESGNQFYRDIFSQLAKSSDEVFLNSLPSDDLRGIYMNPLKNLDRLDQTDPAFQVAINYFSHIQTLISQQKDLYLSSLEKIQKGDTDPVFDTATKAVRDNLVKFRDAIKTKDYATAGLYVVGIWAAYKAFKTLDPAKQGKYKTYFFWAAAAYAGNTFAKNAGFDVLKKLGIKGESDEVEGTPLNALYKVPGLPDVKDRDPSVLRDMATINIKTLYSEFKKTDHPFPQFIDPAKFPDAFPEYDGMQSFRLKGKEGLSYKERDYKKTGHEIYAWVASMIYSYEKLVMPKSYKSFGDAVEKDPILKTGTVLDFTFILDGYVRQSEETGISSIGSAQKAKERFSTVFEKSKLGWTIDDAEFSPGKFYGRVMDYPVVIERDVTRNEYYVFSRADYGRAGGAPHRDEAITTIPAEGDAEEAVNKIEQKIIDIMTGKNGLVSMFEESSSDSVKFLDVSYDPSGHWYADMEYSGNDLMKAERGTSRVLIIPGETGTSVNIKTLEHETLIHVEDVMDPAKLYGSLVLSSMVKQDGTDGKTGFEALNYFYIKNKLRFVRRSGPGTFEIQIGNVKVDGKNTVAVKFDSNEGTYSFVGGEAVEKKIMQSPTFKRELAEVVAESDDLKGPIEKIRKLLGDAPESFVGNFVNGMKNWVSKFTLSAPFRGVDVDKLSGSIGEGHVEALVLAQRELMIAKLQYALDDADELDDVGKFINTEVAGAKDQLQDLSTEFSRMVNIKIDEGDDFSSEEFERTFLDRLFKVGVESKDYAKWYKNFIRRAVARKGRSEEVADLAKVYVYMTAKTDTVDQDGADITAKKPDGLKPEKGSDEYKKEQEAYDKAVLYRINALYNEYVSDQVLLGNIDKVLKYEAFKDNPRLQSEYRGMVDERPLLKSTKDYLTLDVYFKEIEAGEDDPKQNLDSIILPRKNFRLVLDSKGTEKRKKQDAVVKKLLVDNLKPVEVSTATGKKEEMILDVDFIKLTDIEKEYLSTLVTAVNHLKDKSPGKIKKSAFQDFMARYRSAYMVERSGNVLEFTYGHRPTTGPFVPEGSSLSDSASDIEGYLNLGGDTVLRSEQENAIKNDVFNVVEREILDDKFVDDFFKDSSVLTWLKGAGKDIWGTIFGTDDEDSDEAASNIDL